MRSDSVSIDIVNIKNAVSAKRLSVSIQDGNILLGDNQSGERVKIGSAAPVESQEGCSACQEAEYGFDVSWSTEDPQGLTSTNHYDKARFCPFCGRKLIGWAIR